MATGLRIFIFNCSCHLVSRPFCTRTSTTTEQLNCERRETQSVERGKKKLHATHNCFAHTTFVWSRESRHTIHATRVKRAQSGVYKS